MKEFQQEVISVQITCKERYRVLLLSQERTYNYECKELKQHLEDRKKENKPSALVAEEKSVDCVVDADLL